jgi:16S rRNA (cytosine1402-N4)-methyltransferase
MNSCSIHHFATLLFGRAEAAMRHDPVMVREILEALALKPGDVVVDGTIGLAGHSLQFAKLIHPGGIIVGFDWDQAMLAEARQRLSSVQQVRTVLIHDDYRMLAHHLDELTLSANGILLDLGLNLAQIEDPERGITFSQDGPLDMRMNRSKGEPAAALLNRLSSNEIEQFLHEFGDERWARAIARKIVERRSERPLRTTNDLVDCVLAAVPAGARDKRIHPATRTFQAIRIAVNKELDDLEGVMKDAAGSLAEGGTLAVLSYHSGEDRAVKHAFRELSAGEEYEELYRKPLVASAEEIASNPRSRSAKLRALRRVAAA